MSCLKGFDLDVIYPLHFLTNKILMQPRNSFGVYACFQEPGFFEAMNMNMGMTADTSMSPVSDQSLMTFLEQEAHQLIDCQAGRICINNLQGVSCCLFFCHLVLEKCCQCRKICSNILILNLMQVYLNTIYFSDSGQAAAAAATEPSVEDVGEQEASSRWLPPAWSGRSAGAERQPRERGHDPGAGDDDEALPQ